MEAAAQLQPANAQAALGSDCAARSACEAALRQATDTDHAVQHDAAAGRARLALQQGDSAANTSPEPRVIRVARQA